MSSNLEDILSLPVEGRIQPLAEYARGLAAQRTGTNGVDHAALRGTVEALIALIEDGSGSGRERLEMGEVLGLLDDPRLRSTSDPDYWATVTLDDDHQIEVGRFMVTTAEFRAFLAGAYDDDSNWSAEGLAWRNRCEATWAELAADPEISQLVVANQPVVGVTWYEAEAFANANGVRLLTQSERRWVVRGAEKRPDPWGAPFGTGNTNTREEALGRPAAVGLFRRDRTPEGIYDLAGNVGEWTSDRNGEQRIFHPGSWAQPSMASWAKAIEFASAETRSADLGFRVARGA